MPILDAIRRACPADTWSAGATLARQGLAVLERATPSEVLARVRVPGRAVPQEVHLWPEESDWECDCASRADACVHVAAAVIAWSHPPAQASAAPGPGDRAGSRPATAQRPVSQVRHVLTRRANGLDLHLEVIQVDPGGQVLRAERLRGSLASSTAWCMPGDQAVEALLARSRTPTPGREIWPALLKALADASQATLDGAPIQVSGEGVFGVIRVEDEEPEGGGRGGFQVRLVRDPRIQEVFGCGVVRCGNTLHPVGQDLLEPIDRQRLQRGILFTPDEVGHLISEYLPALPRQIPQDIRTSRLPTARPVPPGLALHLERMEDHSLRLLPTLVYGDPPVARVDGERLVLLGGRVPIRDRKEEARQQAECHRSLGTSPGHARTLAPHEAIHLLSRVLPRFPGPVHGREVADRYRLVPDARPPALRVSEAPRGRYRVEWSGGDMDPRALLAAWTTGAPLVPLREGGFAPVPAAWMEAHGWQLAEVLAAVDQDEGLVRAHLAPSLAALCPGDEQVPVSLTQLQARLADFDGIPSTPLPTGLQATLRPYQRRGVDWLAFLRSVDLGGILADDMGLGKTLQALCALAQVPGPHLVVCPTSLVPNWSDEARRFLPRLRVCTYYGAARVLDSQADLVLTSYALLRRDVEALADVAWSYVILDEAQAIKNPDSQVARAALRLGGRHRIALTGTPVENRLEELWSLFSFAMPGFLGSRRAFLERAGVGGEGLGPSLPPLGGGVGTTALPGSPVLGWLRQRVRPFVLRRMKRDVATDLPPRTDMVLRCALGEDQRHLYSALRLSLRGQALADLHAGRTLGVLEALLRLRQAACHPGLLPGSPPAGSAKLDFLTENLQLLAEEGHRALVFSQWTSFLDLVEPALREAGLSFTRLDGSTRNRKEVVQSFQAPDGPAVFLLSLKAGGTGLNLTAADYVFHLDPWWNPAVEEQAIDRTHRIGQQRPVFSCRLIAADTVEERILALQEAKRDLARSVLGDAPGGARQDRSLSGEDEEWTRSLTREDLASLFD